MAATPRDPDAREVVRVEALVTVQDPAQVDRFLAECLPGTTWRVLIRTAKVWATIRDRNPLGSFDERDFLCVTLRLARPVPVEPGLRFQIISEEDPNLWASALVRPWSDHPPIPRLEHGRESGMAGS